MSVRMAPGPPDTQSVQFIRRAPLQFLTAITTTYGDVVGYESDEDTVLIVNRPELARYVLKENSANYTKQRTPDDLMLRPLLGNGLLTSDGEVWARQRRQCAPAFRHSVVLGLDSVIVEAALDLTQRWHALAVSGQPIRVDHDLTALTLGVVVRAMLGVDLTGIGSGFGQAVDAVNRFIGHYSPGEDTDPADTAIRRDAYLRAQAFLNTVVRTIVAARAAAGPGGDRPPGPAGPGRGDLLGTMLSAGHETTGTGVMSATELREQVLTIVMAGHETTAKALTWTLYLLDRHPAVAEHLRDDIDRVVGDRQPTAADLPALEYCWWVIQEAMRLYPPVWLISRRATGADRVGGCDIPPGTLVCVSPYLLHRHAGYWDEPELFRPERFSPDQVAARPSHLYLPFGGGPRICIGQHFAMVEAVLVLVMIMRALRLTTVPGLVVEPEALVTLRPRHGLLMTARVRS
jgi:enediyne biosynthesis protein E7